MPVREITDKHEAKKQFLLAKGIDLMYDRGYNGTSVKDVVQAAGVPKGSFYFYFDSKEDFALQALSKYLQEVNEVLVGLLTKGRKNAKNRLLDFYKERIRQNIELMECRRGCLVNNIASEMATTNETLRKRVLAMFNESTDVVASVIEEGQRSGVLESKQNPHKLAAALEDAWKGALVTMKSCRCKTPLDNFRNITLKHLLQ